MIFLLVILAPLAIAVALLIGPPPGRIRWLLLPLAPLPALLLAMFGDPGRTAVFKWLLLEAHFGLAYSGPVFLFFTAALWTLAGCYAAFQARSEEKSSGGGPRRFCGFWLLALAGNIGLVLAGDVPSFYTFFALMTFAAYGLIVRTGTGEAWRAGRVYIVMALAGEAMLIAAFFLAVAGAESLLLADAAASVATSPRRDLIVLLALGGFAVKAGVFPLHFWLPLAHPVAPTPASAVLSGVMIKAGLLGWIHLLPGGHGAFPGWSLLLIGVGTVTAFYAVACGLSQRNLKTILAYSSVSQMGILLLVVGAGLADPGAWVAAQIVLVVYALNHAFSKGALFLGAGLCGKAAGAGGRTRGLILAGLAVPALAIAGAPLMGGAIAKEAVKIATDIPGEAAPWLRVLLPLSAAATTVLLGRFLLLAHRGMGSGGTVRLLGRESRSTVSVWIVSIAASAGGVYFAVPWYALELQTAEPSWRGIWENLWPIAAGAALLGLASLLPAGKQLEWRIPPGDLLLPMEFLIDKFRLASSWVIGPERWRINIFPTLERWGQSPFMKTLITRGESFFRRREMAGFLMMVFILVLWFLLRV